MLKKILYIMSISLLFLINPLSTVEAKVMWGNIEVKSGIAGKLKVMGTTYMYKKNPKGQFVYVKKLTKGQEFIVYSTTKTHFFIGNNQYVRRLPIIIYTPLPKNLLDLYILENRKITGGLEQNTKKAYGYYWNSFGSGMTSFIYKQTRDGFDMWRATNKSKSQTYMIGENSSKLSIGWAERNELFFEIPYPLTINKKWRFKQTNYLVTSTTKTITTPAGIFRNVIEIKDSEGYLLYYAQGIGNILTVDTNETPATLTKELYELNDVLYYENRMYIGKTKNGREHGKGMMTWDNGGKYNGNFVNGEITGVGKMIWNNGDFYEGNWLDGYMNGVGRYTWANGTSYPGCFQGNAEEGQTICTNAQDYPALNYVGELNTIKDYR